LLHDRLDLARWIREFPAAQARQAARDHVLHRHREDPGRYPNQEALERHIRLLSPGGEIVTGPREVALVEQLREEAFSKRPYEGRRLATDVFVFARGEAPRRETTKVGGLPYWPAGRAWPTGANGRALTFIAQLCFADSLDLTGPLPGDLLLVFGDEHAVFGQEVGRLRFEWLPLGVPRLADAQEIPETGLHLLPCHGVVHRTADFPDAGPWFEAYRHGSQLAVIEGTKIGGVAAWIQDEPELPGRYLCSLGSISPNPRHPFPYVNVSTLSEYEDETLMWGDVGTVFVSLDEAGSAFGATQGY
jgi:hypothetical protein